MYVPVYVPPLSPGPKYGFSLERNAVIDGEEKSKLTYVTPSRVQQKCYIAGLGSHGQLQAIQGIHKQKLAKASEHK